MEEIKKLIKPFTMTLCALVAIVAFNFMNYQSYGSALFRNITPTEITFNDFDLEYTSSKSSSLSRQFYISFEIYNQRYYAACFGYSEVCKNRRRYHVLAMTYLRIDSKHGIIKTMTIVPQANLDAEPRVIKNGFDSIREPDKLMRLYNERVQWARWLFYATILLIPIGIYRDHKRAKEDDE